MSKEEEVKEQKLLLYIKTSFNEYQQVLPKNPVSGH